MITSEPKSNRLISFNKNIKKKLKEIEPRELQSRVKYALWCDLDHHKGEGKYIYYYIFCPTLIML
jgi:hypothetical protein